jgi:hypothetical protein
MAVSSSDKSAKPTVQISITPTLYSRPVFSPFAHFLRISTVVRSTASNTAMSDDDYEYDINDSRTREHTAYKIAQDNRERATRRFKYGDDVDEEDDDSPAGDDDSASDGRSMKSIWMSSLGTHVKRMVGLSSK